MNSRPYKLKVLLVFVLFSLAFSINAQPDPYVEIKSAVNGRIITMTALGTSASGLNLTYLWTQDESNPEQISFSSNTEETVTFNLPQTEGEYFVNVEVTDTEQKLYKARRIITAQNGRVYVNTVDHYPRWVNSMCLYEVNPYSWNSGSGIFNNVEDHFDRLRELGINTIWFTPIFESLSEGMGYWTYDYYELYSGFGSKEDFKSFVESAHENGFRIILDLVINHTGAHHPFFQSCLEEKANSPYADYYIWDGIPGDSNYEYFYDWVQLPNLNVANQEVEDYLIDMAEYWLTHFDIDGYRADVAWGIELRSGNFWKNFTRRLRNIKPEIYLLGEGHAKPVPGSLEENPSSDHDKSILFDDRFNSAYDWELRTWNTDKGLPGLLGGKISIDDLHEILSDEYPDRALPLRFIENHDHPRATELYGLGRSKLTHSLIFTVPGVPLLYCGGEYGQTEQFWALGNDPGGVQDYFTKIIQARRNFIDNDSEIIRIQNNNSQNIYTYATVSSGHRIMISELNFSGSHKQATMDISSLAEQTDQTILLREVISGSNYIINTGFLENLPVSLEAYEAKHFVFNPVENLIINGSFKSGLYPWYTYINEAANASGKLVDESFKMSISGAGSEGWHIQLIQGNIPVEKGEIYEVSFNISSGQTRNVAVIIGEDGNDFTSYFQETIQVNTDKKLYQAYFTMNENTDLKARFVIDMGGSVHDISLDDFILRKKGAVSGGIYPDVKTNQNLCLHQNYPNPFKKNTTVSFGLNKSGFVKITVYNNKGEEALDPIKRYFMAGNHSVVIEGHNLPAGYYICEIKSGEDTMRKKMLMIK